MNKEQIQQQIEELKQIVGEANNKIVELEEQLKKQENTYWIPKKDETYYHIGFDGQVSAYSFDNDLTDKYKLSIGNCYKTREEAEKKGLRKVFEQQLFTKLKRFADEHNEEKIDLKNTRQNKYSFYYDVTENKIYPLFSCVCLYFQQNIYFTSEEIAKQAIEEFKDDLIRYFTKED